MKSRERIPRILRVGALLLGVLLAALGLVWDVGAPGFNSTHVLLGVLGGALALCAVLDRQAKLSARLLLLLSACYLGLLLVETIWLVLSPQNTAWQLRDLMKSDPVIGYALTPGWQGRFDDGVARGAIRVNSLGYRDDEPWPQPARRVLLVGDSFTFGLLLDQAATIDKQLERLRPGWEICNLGVTGYGLRQITETLRRCPLAADEVVYLFYLNDLRDERREPDAEVLLVDGYPVPKKRPDGTAYTPVELRERIAREQRWWARLRPAERPSPLVLPGLRSMLRNVVEPMLQPERYLQRTWTQYTEDEIQLAITLTRELQQLAASRGMKFRVVILPAQEEVRVKRYTQAVAQYLQGVRAAGFPVTELLEPLTLDCYWRHDGHFSPLGAERTAQALNAAWQRGG